MPDYELAFGRWRCSLFMPEQGLCCPMVYLPGSLEDALVLRPMLTQRGAALALIHDIDWNRDLSPWPAPRVFRAGEDFSGGADAFLLALTGELVPRIEELTGAPSFYVCLPAIPLQVCLLSMRFIAQTRFHAPPAFRARCGMMGLWTT